MNGTNKKEARLWETELQNRNLYSLQELYLLYILSFQKRKENQWKKNSVEIVL